MVEQVRRKLKTKRRDKNKDNGEPTKEEYAVAKYVRFNCPTKTATIMGNEMAYFTASKAIDCLMSSKWAGDSEHKLFSNRHACVFYMQNLLDKGLFFRAKKLVPKRKDPAAPAAAAATATTNENADEAKKVEKRKTKKGESSAAVGSGKEKEKVAAQEDSKQKEEGDDKDKHNGKKKTKKIKFDIHQNQAFNDGNDIYVWKYDPTSTKMFMLGLAMVFGSIGICLFPLWPHEVRVGVYYLSILAMVFVGVIIMLVVLRSITFAAVWVLTMGRHHFWLLPHLTDDCGFFDSFKPLYSHIRVGADKEESSGQKKKGKTDKKSSSSEKNDNSSSDKDKESVDGKNFDDEEENSGAEKDSDVDEDVEEIGVHDLDKQSDELSDEDDGKLEKKKTK